MKPFVPLAMLAILAGCAVAPTAPVAAPTSAPSTSALPPTPTPVPTQAIAADRLTHGTLYDGYGQPLHQPATVHIVATDPGVSFDATTTATDGTWQIPDVPAGKLEVSATVAGWPVRVRRLDPISIGPTFSGAGPDDAPTARIINFGGPYDPRHEFDRYFYLAPEIPYGGGPADMEWPILTPGATPSCRYPATTGDTTWIFQGFVRDTAGKLLDATVHISAPNVPYTASTTTDNGQWVINNVPRGGDLTITVTADGYQPRTRVLGTGWYHEPVYEPYPSCTIRNDTKRHFSFGGPATVDDPDAPGFALEPLPAPSASPG